MNLFLQTSGLTSSNKSKLQKYLDEGIDTSANLNILDWWKVNLGRFPILSNIARELLAMHVSTVASESTFSTCGRVLDPFCSFLSHEKSGGPYLYTRLAQRYTPSAPLLDFDLEKLQCFDKGILFSNFVVIL